MKMNKEEAEARTLLIMNRWSERKFRSEVLKLAQRNGWLGQYKPDNKESFGYGSNRGFPDISLAKNGKLILAELKTNKGRVSQYQLNWQDHLPEDVYRLWRPNDWFDIVAELTA